MAQIAQIFLSPLLSGVYNKLMEPAIQEIKSLLAIDGDLEKLENTLAIIQDVVEDAEEKQISSKAIRKWLAKLKDVAYDADDILDEVATEALLASTNQEEVWDSFSSFFSSKNPILYGHEIASKISEIRGRFDEIAKERRDLFLENRDGGKRCSIRVEDRPQTSSLIDDYDVIGREFDKEEIVRLLVSDEFDGKCVSVVPIVGMGGLGKTTLAQFVYNDERVENHFGLRAWGCVSDDFDVLRITNAIIESATGCRCDLSNMDAMQRRLRGILKDQRVLLVLDDVWDENPNQWDRIRIPFGVVAEGSRIIVTTRSTKVAMVMGTIPAHHLAGLPDDDCWELLTRRAFVMGSSNVHPELERIGRQIVQKCQGLPLAVKTLGGLLSCKRSVSQWESILTSEIWKDDENEILPALRLSYHHLPADQKQCFAYCSIFPKDHDFTKDKLVQLWMAAGFIRPKGSTLLEDIGGELFNDLLLKSFFQHSHHNNLGNSIYYMHDLMHDLAESISGDECLRIEGGMLHTIPKIARHSSLSCYNEDPIPLEALYKCKSLRTFLVILRSSTYWEIPNDIFLELRCLRALDLSNSAIVKLPYLIGHLKHLRYLDLSCTNIKMLPESVTSLCNLQTLNLENCRELRQLPKGIINLINLRHLALDWNSPLWISLPGIGKLTSLQKLPEFVVRQEDGYRIEELKNMRNLRGGIHISRLENLELIEEAMEANLIDKRHLDELDLQWGWDHRSGGRGIDDETILEGLQPHPNLKKLVIDYYYGVSFPSWMGHLSNLTRLSLITCSKCEYILPPDEQLPSLRELYLNRCHELQELPDLLPVLTKLEIKGCEELYTLPRLSSVCHLVLDSCDEELLSSVPYLTSLSSLTIKDFQSLRSLPHGFLQPLTALEELEIKDCDELECWPKEAGLQELPSLQHLVIENCAKLESLADCEGGFPITLTSLEINKCPNLKSMPTRLENLTSLKYLPIVTQLPFFSSESSLPTTIEKLEIFSCLNLKFLPKGMQKLTYLTNLHIQDCPQLHCLFPVDDSNDYELPTTLGYLTISRCQNFKSLPKGMQKLMSLQLMCITDCPEIVSLPEDGLPTSLQCLQILGCPKLNEQCQKERGQDWSMIQHIPDVYMRD
ncbi:putative disease resistance protein RGA3 [Tasmannia lanceolata]|uniref:putative disease resistance protein RGA3 n=1 Tax=Tasmannia lanceolata TaxID=3420 RepID=UPI0040636777